MEQTPGGPAIVMALVLAEAAVGGLAVLWLVPAWGNVKNGFFKLLGAVITSFAILAWLAARAPLLRTGIRFDPTTSGGAINPLLADAPQAARIGVLLLAMFAGACVVWQILLWAGAHRTSRIAGITAWPIGAGALVAIALDPSVRASHPIAIFQLLAGALFVGAVTDGMILGHWHLVDRKLSRRPLYNVNRFFLIGCAVSAIAAIAGGTGGGRARASLSPLLAVGGLTLSVAIGLAALCALIGFFIRALIRESSLQSATGLFYLGIMMAFAGEFAAKVRFF